MKTSKILKWHLHTSLFLFFLCMSSSTFAEREEDDALKPLCKRDFSSSRSQEKKLENASLEPFAGSLFEDDNIKRTSQSGCQKTIKTLHVKKQKSLSKKQNRKAHFTGLFLKGLRDIAVGVAHCSTYSPYNFNYTRY